MLQKWVKITHAHCVHLTRTWENQSSDIASLKNVFLNQELDITGLVAFKHWKVAILWSKSQLYLCICAEKWAKLDHILSSQSFFLKEAFIFEKTRTSHIIRCLDKSFLLIFLLVLHFEMEQNIPVIDVSPIALKHLKPTLDDYQQVAFSLSQALSTWGFAYLTNHGVSQSTVHACFKQSTNFFNLPQNDKDKFA